MTIKEIETLSGMTRANIRFYETEGLLNPARGENGYRNYREADLTALQRIRLLRLLDVPLDHIKELQTGKRELPAVLQERLDRLAEQQKQLARAGEVCRAMQADGARFETLDAPQYLRAWERDEPAPVPAGDALPRVRAPFRRLFARLFDLFLCRVLWTCLMVLLVKRGVADLGAAESLLNTVGGLLLMFLLEPLLLSVFGTTPGKFLLGLWVRRWNGDRLSYREARMRTGTALIMGCGLDIPLVRLWRLYKSYRACVEEQPLEWEEDSLLTEQPVKFWHGAVMVGLAAGAFGALYLSFLVTRIPPHRAPLTVADFSDNYNHYIRYYDLATNYRLQRSGQWIEPSQYAEGGGVYIVIGEPQTPPTLEFFEQDGVLSGLCLTVTSREEILFPGTGGRNEMLLCLWAFAGAQPEADLRAVEVEELAARIQKQPFTNFTLTACGVTAACTVEYAGYQNTGEVLIAAGSDAALYTLQFTLTRQAGL